MLRMHPGCAHVGPWLQRLLLSPAWVRLAGAPPAGTVRSASVQAAQQLAGRHGAASRAQGGSADRLQRFRRSGSAAAGEGGSVSVSLDAKCSEDWPPDTQRTGDDVEGSATPMPAKNRLDPGLYLVATPIGKFTNSSNCATPHNVEHLLTPSSDADDHSPRTHKMQRRMSRADSLCV